MQELRITQTMDGYFDELILTDEGCNTNILLLRVKDDNRDTSIVLEKHHAKNIISFLQNNFDL